MSDSVIIVGAGHAGTTLAFRLRELSFEGSVDLIGDEPEYPYHRPLLSKKYLLGEVNEAGLHLKNPDQYQEKAIRLRSACTVVDVDARNRCVHLGDGEVLPYHHLVLATGSRPRTLGHDPAWGASNVHVLRNLEHARALRASWRQGERLLIVGGGYVGLEAAAVARAMGMQVTVLERSERILNRVACQATADVVKELHVRKGVKIIENTSLTHLDTCVQEGPDSSVSTLIAVRAHLDSGEVLDFDHVLVGVGAVPEVSLAANAGLELNDGIVTDAQMRTSDPHILAIGDCASLEWHGKRIRLESVPNALEMANVAAHTIVDSPKPYQGTPWFWSDQYDLKLQTAGLNMGYTQTVSRRLSEQDQAPISSVWYFEGDRLIALDAFNDAKAFMLGKRWIGSGISPDPEDLRRPDLDLRSLALKPTAAAAAHDVSAHA